MPGISEYDCDGTLVIGGISMNRPAWAISADEVGEGGLLQLITNVEQRGDDRLIPTASGMMPFRRRITRTTHELRMLVVGEVDANGTEVVDHSAGLTANLRYLFTNIVAPVATPEGTRLASYTAPDGATTTADIHVTGMRQSSYRLGPSAVWEGQLLISVPAGVFA